MSELKSGLVLPEHRDADLASPVYGFARGWNACLDELARLNPAAAQAPPCFAILLEHAQGLATGTCWNLGAAATMHRDALVAAVSQCQAWLAAPVPPVQQAEQVPVAWQLRCACPECEGAEWAHCSPEEYEQAKSDDDLQVRELFTARAHEKQAFAAHCHLQRALIAERSMAAPAQDVGAVVEALQNCLDCVRNSTDDDPFDLPVDCMERADAALAAHKGDAAQAQQAEQVPAAWVDPARGLIWLVDRTSIAPGAKLYTAPPAAPAQDVAVLVAGAPSIESAYAMGAKGGVVADAERLAFESWMAGHCWPLCAAWDGGSYKCESEQSGSFNPAAGMTRRLWAAWRDRAALAAHKGEAVPAAVEPVDIAERSMAAPAQDVAGQELRELLVIAGAVLKNVGCPKIAARIDAALAGGAQ